MIKILIHVAISSSSSSNSKTIGRFAEAKWRKYQNIKRIALEIGIKSMRFQLLQLVFQDKFQSTSQTFQEPKISKQK